MNRGPTSRWSRRREPTADAPRLIANVRRTKRQRTSKVRTPDRKPTGDLAPASPESIFEPDSIACAAALNDLSVVMKQVGFIVDKKRDSESTLRVYVRKRLTYPLLNPRFQRRSIRGFTGRAILEITALSKGDEALERRLAAFPS
jgi:hypothetical protein